MRKTILPVLMAATISLSLLACGSNKAGESETIPNIAEAETTSTAAEAEEISTTVEAENTSTATEAEARQNETTTENESTETTEVITKDSTETPATTEVTKEAENFNINGFGYSNYIDLYGAGNGYEDVERIAIMATNCTAYTEYPAQMSSDTTTSRGIKLGDSREQVIAAYGESRNEVVYKSKAYNHDGLESQYNLCYSYLDERYPEVFFNLSFSMDQNDNVLDICYEAILMKWYK